MEIINRQQTLNLSLWLGQLSRLLVGLRGMKDGVTVYVYIVVFLREFNAFL